MSSPPPQAFHHVAAYFQALAEPTRLQIINLLREGERNVGELAQLCGFSAANISRHLTLLTQRGLVKREARGTAVYYQIADDSIYSLCDLVCRNVMQQLQHAAEQQSPLQELLEQRSDIAH
ncbi:ArsR family transcriptional regulator [Stenotrophomonas sp. MH181796]|uniref:ArsR/SmtB family transcription factor n=1 Tax=Pseudomonadota TaxID=1224 RepID=UPI00129CA248|nr:MULTISPECIES: metalloregulator ArsR/SmtB family transcription factor [Pseudomonadota]MCD0497228.1 metalloregulator ArsR/SmtB family transcription factor [Achromobacter sp. MY14]MDN4684202.1 metalloregulator ArsR/SmtB family transcription factor [Pseudomonas aeruginosa]MDP5439760.1 metalloregulator ArsR/SmtB family transcription factor [Pseudomonas aeruginosa]MRI42032.1 ArsR family transcriptional regulator [Stenotrophomonas sp. MH181796]